MLTKFISITLFTFILAGCSIPTQILKAVKETVGIAGATYNEGVEVYKVVKEAWDCVDVGDGVPEDCPPVTNDVPE